MNYPNQYITSTPEQRNIIFTNNIMYPNNLIYQPNMFYQNNLQYPQADNNIQLQYSTPIEIFESRGDYNKKVLQFFNYLIKKFDNPQSMKESSLDIIRGIYVSLQKHKFLNYIDIATIMYDFAIKIKGCIDKKGNQLFGFNECGFVGTNGNEIKFDFVLKFSEFLAFHNFNFNTVINKYIYSINFYAVEKINRKKALYQVRQIEKAKIKIELEKQKNIVNRDELSKTQDKISSDTDIKSTESGVKLESNLHPSLKSNIDPK
jgi:hypothetical protein